MNQTAYRVLTLLVAAVLILSACGSPTAAEPTPDAAAIATAAAQTVEARFTQQALVDLATQVASASTGTPVPELAQSSPTPETTKISDEYKPGCVYATYVTDLTIPDGMIIAPGTTFTKTWRIKNAGSCKWDTRFAMIYISGDTMSTQTSFPLPRIVYPGQDVDVSVTLTAPAVNGKYRSEWRLGVPVGSAGVGPGDENLSVSIEVTNKPERDFAVSSVVYGPIVRNPAKGCVNNGATYTFTATISVNGPGEIVYEWDRQPDDGVFEGGKLKFSAAGSQEVNFTWTMTDHVQGWDRWVAISTSYGTTSQQFERLQFTYKCDG